MGRRAHVGSMLVARIVDHGTTGGVEPLGFGQC
jgi:hypothetical protein